MRRNECPSSLRELTSRGSFSLLGLMDTALEVPRLGGVKAGAKSPKRNAVVRGAYPPATRQRADWPFVSGLQQVRTPEGTVSFCVSEATMSPQQLPVLARPGTPGLPCPAPIDTPGSGGVYDQKPSPVSLGGLVYTRSGGDTTE